jgi:hypothetical protein
MRRPSRLLGIAVRCLAWSCLLATLWPVFGVAANGPAPASVPIVSKLSGAVSVRGKDGVSNDVISSRIIHSGDVLMTGVDSLALINLADVGSIRIGPASTALAKVVAQTLTVDVSSGSACAQAVSKGVEVVAGPMQFWSADDNAIFSLIRTQAATTLAVYQGSVTVTVGETGHARTMSFKAGEAASSSGAGLSQVPLSSVQPSFDALQCPAPDIIAQVMPSPVPSPSAGGHGGGAGGILAALLGIGAIVAAAGGHGGGGNSSPGQPPPPPSSPTPTPTPTPTPGALTVGPGSLTFALDGSAQTFGASEANYSGPINAVSKDTGIATVTPASASGPSAQFTVSPIGVGSTTITVTDNHGGQQNVSVTVVSPGSIILTPGGLTFLVGSAAQTFSASEASYDGPLTAVSNDTSVATVSGSGNGPGPVTFTVTPVGAGTTTITVSGGASPARLNVAVVGPLTANPSSLTFLGTSASQNFTASDPFYSGTITASSTNPSVATVAPVGSSNGPSATFAVTPVGAGNANITVSDALGGNTVVSVSVSSGGLEVNPTTLTFTVGGADQQFNASEADYTGNIFASSSKPTQARVSPASGTGPGPVTFTVHAVAAGNPTIAVTDDHGGSQFVDVTITGPITVGPPSSLTFNGTTTPQTLSVSDANYFGSIGASSSNVTVATVNSPLTGPNASFTVTPVGSGTATITFSDANGGSATANVTVNPGPLDVSTNSLSLSGPGSTMQFTASETLYNGPISAASQDTTVATVAPPSGSGPGPVTFTATAVGPGSTNIQVTDNHGGSQLVSVAVTETPTLTPNSFAFSDVGPANAQGATLSEPGYNGNLNLTANSCGPLATISPASVAGPSGAITVTANSTASGGTCSFAYKDSFGNTTAAASVTVGPFGSINLSPTSLTFTDVGSSNNQTFTATESSYSGTLTVDASACNNIASVSPSSGASGATFTVTPSGSGTCTVKVSDDHTQSANEGVTVGPFGSISPSPASFSFSDVGAGAAQPLSVSESNYTGTFTVDDSACSGIATVSPSSSRGSFTVTPTGQGSCNLTITDDHASPAATVAVNVGPFGAPMPSAVNLNLTVGGSSSSFTVSESGYTGNFTLTDSSCMTNGAASVSPLSGTAATTFTVTPGSSANNCKIVVTDDVGQTANVFVFVTAGSLTVNPNELQFPANSAGQTMQFSASDPACIVGDFMTATADGTVAASVSPSGAQACTGLPLTFTVTAGANGQGSVTVSDTVGGSAVVSVGVGASPLRKKHHPLAVHRPVPTTNRIGTTHKPANPIIVRTPPSAPKPVTGGAAAVTAALRVSVSSLALTSGATSVPVVISEAGYSRSFVVSSSDPQVAAASSQNPAGPSATIVISAHAQGFATIRVADDHGGIALIQVMVRTSGPKGLPRRGNN